MTLTDPRVVEAEDDVEPVWHTLGDGGPRETGATVAPRRLLTQLVVGTLAVLLVVGLGASLAARRLAEREAVADAVSRAGVLADAVVSPVLTDGLVAGAPPPYAASTRWSAPGCWPTTTSSG